MDIISQKTFLYRKKQNIIEKNKKVETDQGQRQREDTQVFKYYRRQTIQSQRKGFKSKSTFRPSGTRAFMEQIQKASLFNQNKIATSSLLGKVTFCMPMYRRAEIACPASMTCNRVSSIFTSYGAAMFRYMNLKGSLTFTHIVFATRA